MKITRTVPWISTLFLILFSVITSCTKDKQAGGDYLHFVSKDLSIHCTKAYMTTLLDIAASSNPEVLSIKSLVNSDVTVYKVVYKTTIDGNEIKASGLVCVPSVAGNYPVLSFQNGTNTLNTYAPTEFPTNYSYQLVEFIASMGYIVTIADYPGFGESSQIPHPYLVAEPTVRSLVDMLYAVKELTVSELPGITLKNEFYLLGYSQGGWATLALHKALELDYPGDFDLIGSACGAGPYDISLLMKSMIDVATYPMPVYLGYIFNAYHSYSQFTNPVTDIFNEPYASVIPNLYNGLLSSDQINNQLTTSIPDLINPDFLSGFETDPKYSSVRTAFNNNSITAWHSYKPLLFLHGELDLDVNPISTENIYNAMIQSGTSANICTKVIIPGVNHSKGVVPSMVQGILFLNSLRDKR